MGGYPLQWQKDVAIRKRIKKAKSNVSGRLASAIESYKKVIKQQQKVIKENDNFYGRQSSESKRARSALKRMKANLKIVQRDKRNYGDY